ncbi:hypothetical protein FEM03_16720 [Phragmitibacter flavus]|uniref:Uncharacterized protein n=1 Tax=Phragmitibacter flavus TaxID=2576071 RepID=A0A5R8KBC7_9BACT|nr:hypothetical protein FEM03_16720 [Phragmitibacter flavus]
MIVLACIVLFVIEFILRSSSTTGSVPIIPIPDNNEEKPPKCSITKENHSTKEDNLSSFDSSLESSVSKMDDTNAHPTILPTNTRLPHKNTSPSQSDSTSIAVIDSKRLLEKLLPSNASLDTRAQIIQNILQVTSALAASKDIELVFDTSGESPINVPVVFSGHDLPDLTDEVHHELTK